MRQTRNPVDRFWEKVDVRSLDECWPWLTGCNWKGYGKFWLDGRSRQAHQLAYEYFFGEPIPVGSDTMHSCDNPICCNPFHLSPGSRKDNHQDRARKGRSARGERHPNAVLTTEKVIEIRERYAKGDISRLGLAKHYGVSEYCIAAVVTRATWSHTGLTKRITRTRIEASNGQKSINGS